MLLVYNFIAAIIVFQWGLYPSLKKKVFIFCLYFYDIEAREDLLDEVKKLYDIINIRYKMMKNITLMPLRAKHRKQFIKDLQAAFLVAVIEEYGEQQEEIISQEEIEESLDAKGAQAFQVVANKRIVGGIVVVINKETQRNSLDLFFIKQDCHSKGLGTYVWQAIEQKYPDTKVWETVTPYFEKRNIHFYVNKCGFKIVEFYNPYHLNPHMVEKDMLKQECFFRFEKDMIY